ncbi:MarR family winged helix-turn-helix transcriptional regulator [Actinomadura opuntiae]|uniref:MarR family winged helix-turn-helix transcriptional regulator n=1 Tax=Actinomadura sp. OS1-43 TaxID=604315 RepID=UPI00255A8B74|nr:MarR family winged helix-turn-helix transcriptional regulator [Actinomadura sp. OS1-43]MDL4815377.1 MarR family winged helix-turn-helix transcriptional regulator [Actinomadura sp. OS1-43]
MDDERKQPDPVDAIAEAWARERPGMPVGSIGIITRVWRAAKLLGDERRRTLARLGIDTATLDLLSTLRRHGPPYAMTPGELREASLLTAGAITQRVARAERARLVETVRGPRGRTSSVRLSDTGNRLIEDSVHRLLAHEDSLLDHLDEDERARLTELLRRLLDGLVERLGADDKPGQVGE